MPQVLVCSNVHYPRLGVESASGVDEFARLVPGLVYFNGTKVD